MPSSWCSFLSFAQEELLPDRRAVPRRGGACLIQHVAFGLLWLTCPVSPASQQAVLGAVLTSPLLMLKTTELSLGEDESAVNSAVKS